jgi:branched-chain amino acid transport system permease protein
MRAIVLVAALAALAFPMMSGDYLVALGINTLLYALLAVGWNVIAGYGGMMSFGQAAFFGIGAYASTILWLEFGVSPWIGMAFGAVVSAALAVAMAFLCFHFKLKGWYFGLVTLAFADLLLIGATNFFPGRASGLMIPLNASAGSFQFGARGHYYAVLGFLALALLVSWLVERSRLGARLRAIREDEDVAESLGVPLMRTKLIAFAISGAITAVGGTLYAQHLMFIDPDLVFHMNITIEIVIRALVGGLGTLFGPVLGSLILTPLGEVMNVVIGSQTGLHRILYGVVLIVVIMRMPHGVLGLPFRRRAA